MGLSPTVIQAHITDWEAELKRGNRPYRQHWPSRLFRHEPLDNAVQILKSEFLLSRTGSDGRRPVDIAPPEIIQSREAAHNFVRLYFRPKNPTQYHIEGIRKANEIYLGRHAPVLVIFVFMSATILSQEGVEFSDGNMQSRITCKGSTDQEFQELPFKLIYHEGVFDPHTPAGQEIIRCRCAEVLVPSPMPLKGNLQAVLCRSPAERVTLLHLLGGADNSWSKRIRVFAAPGLFENIYSFVDTVDASDESIRFKLHPRRDGADVKVEGWIFSENDVEILRFGPVDLSSSTPWRVDHSLQSGLYITRVHLENCLAYEAPFLIDDLPF